MSVTPYKNDKSKREQVETMFDNIAPKYDFLNRFLSLGIDIIWRKKAIKKLKVDSPKLILDIATGTGDFALEALSLKPDKIIGVDISEGMLAVGRKKIAAKNLSNKIELVKGDSEKLNFNDNTFDAVIVAFGVRNFENLEKGIADIYRVLKPNGKLVVLEFSNPKKFPVKQFYTFYSSKILPRIGNSISKDKSAYTYLPESVMAFPDGDNFTNVMKKVNFNTCTITTLSGGIASIYTGKK